MTSFNLSTTAMGVAMAALVSVLAFTHGTNQQPAPVLKPAAAALALPQPPALAFEPERRIVVSLQDRKLALLEDGYVVKVYRVAIGKPSTPSPVGTFTIEHRVVNPTYFHKGVVIPPGPENPIGNRWMSLSLPGYGIHGTNVPNSIGKASSHGCIRMAQPDLEDLFSRVRIGDKVELVAQPDNQTAQFFGGAPRLSAAQPTLLAVKTAPAARPAHNPAPDQDQAFNATARVNPAAGANKGAVGAL